MRLRTYLAIANGASIAFILVSVFVCYTKMLLSLPVMLWLISITLLAGALSSVLHFWLTRPIQRSIEQITMQTEKMAEGDYSVAVPLIGPREFRTLAGQFNRMSGKVEEHVRSLQSSEASRRELVANVSHDLRTPLASIQSFVEALQDDIIQDEATFRRYLATIQAESRRLGGLIDDLFRLSRLESGAEPFEPVAFDVDNLIVGQLQAHSLQIEEKALSVAVCLPETLPPVWIVPEKMNRVVANLLQNAIAFSPTRGRLTIVARETPDGFIEVAISDEGEGVPPEEREPIFDRFYRVDKSRNRRRGGAGLGLAIVRATVLLHGGQVGVDSGADRGSRFWFTMPIPRRSDQPT